MSCLWAAETSRGELRFSHTCLGDAQAVDRATAKAILGLATDLSHEQACGATPVTGLTQTARRRRLKPELIDLRNSGDTAGDKTRVVGYGAFAFYEETRDAR